MLRAREPRIHTGRRLVLGDFTSVKLSACETTCGLTGEVMGKSSRVENFSSMIAGKTIIDVNGNYAMFYRSDGTKLMKIAVVSGLSVDDEPTALTFCVISVLLMMKKPVSPKTNRE